MLRRVPLVAIAVTGTVMLALPAMAAHKHAGSCYDYAWQSQDMKDCLADRPMHHNMRAMHARMHESGKRGHMMMKHMPRQDMPMNKS
jgi:hypothetical protein